MTEQETKYCKTEDFTDKKEILFHYILSPQEKKHLSDIIYDVINKYDSSEKSIKFVSSKTDDYKNLLSSLEKFFTENKGSYFIRLSTLSPKDSYYYLNRTPNSDSDSDSEEEKTESIDDVRKRLEILKVSSPMECIQVLLHSHRVFCDLESESIGQIGIILTKWLNIKYNTETRCYVKNKKLLAFSQYYTDCDDYYHHLDIDKFYTNICDFIEALVKDKNKVPYENAIIDVCYLDDGKELHMIEINNYDQNTDSCLYSWEELEKFDAKDNPKFRFKTNGEIIDYEIES